MRPTSLQYRYPKEKTGEYLLPIVNIIQVTADGRCLKYYGASTKKSKTYGFSTEDRFRDYKILSKRTGKLVGPGTYQENIAVKKIQKNPGTINIKKIKGIQPLNSYSYYMVGDHLVYEPTIKQFRNYDSYSNSHNLSIDSHFIDHFNVPIQIVSKTQEEPFSAQEQYSRRKDALNSLNISDSEKKRVLKKTYDLHPVRPSTGVYGCSSTGAHSFICISDDNRIKREEPKNDDIKSDLTFLLYSTKSKIKHRGKSTVHSNIYDTTSILEMNNKSIRTIIQSMNKRRSNKTTNVRPSKTYEKAKISFSNFV